MKCLLVVRGEEARRSVYRVMLLLVLVCVTCLKGGDCLTCHCNDCSSTQTTPFIWGSCDTTEEGACFTKVMGDGVVKRGCLEEKEASRECVGQSESVYQCCHSNRCNKRTPLLHEARHLRNVHISSESPPPSPQVTHSNQEKNIAIITGSVCVFLVTSIIALVITSTICCFCFYHGNHQTHAQSDLEVGHVIIGNCCSAIIPQGETISSLLAASYSPANSAPSPSLSLLVQRAIVKSTTVDTDTLLRNGEFYQLSAGRWRRERVMVKTYLPKYEAMWFTETQIHQVPHMFHPHILTFIGADYLHRYDQLKHYLITEYHERGSLHDYLRTVTLDSAAMAVLAQSAASGLAHLHLDIRGLKPSIVHRNVSSRSFFVKNDGTCCLGDLSLAIKDDSCFQMELKGKSLGLAPYLSPELLDDAIPVSVDSLKKADVYALGLVFWEIARRCSIQGLVDDAEVPFSSLIPFDHTSLKEAREVVWHNKMRPPLSEHWNQDQTMQSCVQVFMDCWHDNPSLRPSASSVKNSLDKLVPQGMLRVMEGGMDKPSLRKE